MYSISRFRSEKAFRIKDIGNNILIILRPINQEGYDTIDYNSTLKNNDTTA